MISQKAQLIYLLVVVLVLNFKTSHQEYVCGRAVANRRTPRIIGGEETAPGEFPWTVSIKLNGQPICGGSLINKSWILTAAHCVVGYNPRNLTVRLGAYSIKDIYETQTVDSRISMFIIHKQYSMPRPFSNDIALMKMIEPVEYTDFIVPICLPIEDQTFVNDILTDYTASSSGIVVSTMMSDKEISKCFKRLEQNYLNSIGLGSSGSPQSKSLDRSNLLSLDKNQFISYESLNDLLFMPTSDNNNNNNLNDNTINNNNDNNNMNINSASPTWAQIVRTTFETADVSDNSIEVPNVQYSGYSGTVVGWGWVRENDGDDQLSNNNKGYPSATLQKVKLPILRNADCEAWFQSQAKKITLLPSQFCAGFNAGGKDACRGDSGGPMIIEDSTDSGRYKLIGIVSAGIGCARPSLPGLYTRVASFLPWIHAQISTH